MTVVQEGAGTAFVNGDRICATLVDGRIHIGATQFEPTLPESEKIQAFACRSDTTILVTGGQSALDKPRMPGPSLCPIPTEGTTAQRFGSYPEKGMSLWRFAVDPERSADPDGSADSVAERLAFVSGIEEIRDPIEIDGRRVAYHAYHFPSYGERPWSRLMVVDAQTGEVADLLPDLPGATMGLALSPDKRRQAFLHSTVHASFPFWFRLAVRTQDGPVQYPLPETIRLTGATPVWSPDGAWVAVTAFEGIRVIVITVSILDDAPPTWTWRRLRAFDGVYRNLAPHNDGSVLCVRHAPGEPAAIVQLTADRSPRVVGPSPAAARDSSVNYQLIRWENGGHTFEGIYARASDATGTPPLIVDIHGGPVNGLQYSPHPHIEDWCSRGFSVFAPDYRGSGIAGLAEMMRVMRGEAGAVEDECNDVLTGVSHLIDCGLADERALFVFGHSAGASLVNQLVARTNRFRAAVSWETHTDDELGYYLAWGGGGLTHISDMYGGSPVESPDIYRRQSATSQAGNVKTPLLLLYGDDLTAPAIKWYTLLREHGVETDLIFYRGEGHVMQRPENQRDVFDRSAVWFRRFAVEPSGFHL